MSLHKAAKEVKIVPIFQSSVPVQYFSLMFQSSPHIPDSCGEGERKREDRKKHQGERKRGM